MSTPKSVTKVKKIDGKVVATYESFLDATEYKLFELTRAALRDVGKLLRSRFKEAFYKNFQKRSGNAGKATKCKVYSNQNTKYPHLQIGLKTGKVDGFYAYFQEFGTHDGRVKKLGLLSQVAKDSYTDIRTIESQYLSYIDAPDQYIDENDEGDNDED